MTDLKSAIPYGMNSMVYCVPSGTVIGQDNEGNDMVVTETSAVNRGSEWWVTEKIFESIKANTQQRAS